MTVLPSQKLPTKDNKDSDISYVTYVRVSTEKDEQISSVPNQIDVCRYWLESNGFEWDEDSIVKDEGITGTILLDRPAMQLILEKARHKEIQMAVFKSINRIARDTKDSLEIREVLSSHNVRIISIEEGYDSYYINKGDMRYEMSSLFAEQYSRMLSVNISGVLAAKVRRGEHIGKTPFGYERIEKKLQINEDQAPTIRLIFSLYNSGWGFKRITHHLNELLENGEVSKPHTKDWWQVTTIQRIVRNPVYCGVFVLNQYRKEKVAGRKKQIKNPPEKWVVFENQHPAIITRDEWEKANSKEVVNKKRKITPWNDFRGIAKCANCGSNMVIVQSWKARKNGERTHWRYIKCSSYRRSGTSGCVNHVPITYDEFKELILGQLLEKGKSINLNFKSDYEKKRMKDLKNKKTHVDKLKEKKKGLIDLHLEGMITKAEFEEKREDFDKQIKKYEDEIFLLQQKEHNQNHIRSIQEAFTVIEKQDKDLHNALATLINEIVVHQDGTIDISYTFQK